MNREDFLTSGGGKSIHSDLRILSEDELSQQSTKRITRLINDLNQEIPHMPAGLRHPFQIIRDMFIEMLGE